jgi:hypothetical protein
MAPSRSTPLTELLTNTDWSNSSWTLSPAGAEARIACSAFLTPLTSQRRGVSVLDHAEQDRTPAILAHDVLLHHRSVADLRHVL